MRLIFFFFLVSSNLYVTAQDKSATIQKNIDKTVWAPFQKAYESLDAKSLNMIYANEVLRVTPEGIDTQNEFKDKNLESFKGFKENNTTIKLDFWFDSRHTNNDTSYEVGFYKIAITTDNKTQYVYSQFHIVLEKIKGQWKITQDWDTTTINGEQIKSEDFDKKESLKF